MSQISDLVFRFLHRQLGASLGVPTTYTASGGTTSTAVSAALVEADNYWNGALVQWATGANAGLWSAVAGFVSATHTLTFDDTLPNAVANNDTFILLHGGKYVSNQAIPGLTAGAPVNVTGFTIPYAAMVNGAGNGTLKFYYNGGAGQSLTWTPPGGVEGPQVDITGLANGQSTTLYGGGAPTDQASMFVIVKRNAAALPVANQTDVIALTVPTGTFLSSFTGTETSGGITVYRAVGILNTGNSKVYSCQAFCPSPWPSAANTTIAVGSGGLGTGAAPLTGASFASWGTSGWVYNQTKNDVRYFYNRSGNVVQTMNPAGGMRGFTAVAWNEGDTLVPFPWFDIGLDAGVANLFQDPASESTAPAGVTFSCPLTQAAGLAMGDLAANALYVVWEKFFIPVGMYPVNSGLALLRIYGETTI